MLSLIISLLIGLAVGMGLPAFEVTGVGWAIFLGILAFVGAQLSVSLLLKKLIMARMNAVQAVVQQGQMQLQRKVQVMQSRPMGSVKQAQKMLEKDQRKFVEEAIAETSALEPFFKWSPLLSKQVATMKMQFYYQLQNWKKVDELMPKCIFMEPLTSAMKMARMYMLKQYDEIEAVFNKAIKKLRGNQGAILYALYSWILVKQDKADEATKVLVDAKKKFDHQTLNRNWEQLANNRPRQFSNSGFGEEWYALGLEKPKVNVKRQRQQRGGFRRY